MQFKSSLCLSSLSVLLSFASAPSVANIQRTDNVREVRLYAMDCGQIDVKDMGPFFSDTGELDGRPGRLSDPCFLIRHPKGAMIWDTGLGDKIAESKEGVDNPVFGIHLSVAIKLADQLNLLGLTPADITYVAFSHFHFDHTGNAGLFTHAIWIVNKNELANAAQSPVPLSIDPGIAAEASEMKLQLIDGDYDVFGDGSVRILKTPGHTPGHQSLEIQLKNSGTVLLTGDLYHQRESRKLRLVPALNYERADTLASIDRFERIAKNTKAHVVIQHDQQDFQALPKFPEHLD
jgi:N-acyl homoserine lactone hydrolase